MSAVSIKAIPPRTLLEHTCWLGKQVLADGCHTWDVTLDSSRSGSTILVGVADAAAVDSAPLAAGGESARLGFEGQGVHVDAQGVASFGDLADTGHAWDGLPAPRTSKRSRAAAPARDRAPAWGLNPREGAVYRTLDARHWGTHLAPLVAENDVSGAAALRGAEVSSVRVTVDLGARRLFFSVNGGAAWDSGVDLPSERAVRPWVLLHHPGDTAEVSSVRPCSPPAAASARAEAGDAARHWSEIAAEPAAPPPKRARAAAAGGAEDAASGPGSVDTTAARAAAARGSGGRRRTRGTRGGPRPGRGSAAAARGRRGGRARTRAAATPPATNPRPRGCRRPPR